MINQNFQRTLTLKNSIYLGLSSMIGAGIFNNLAPTSKLSSYSSILGLIFAATLAFSNAASSAQLAAIFPETGGTYLYAKKVLGQKVANIAGVVFIVGKTISCVAIALTLGNYISPIYSKEIATLLSVLVFTLSFFGVQKTAFIAKWLVWILLGILSIYSISILTTSTINLNIPVFNGFSITSFLISSSIWFFAFTGYSRLATFGEEIKNPGKIIPLAIFVGLGVTIFVYLVISWLTFSIVNPEIIMNSSTPLLVAMNLSRFSEFSFLITYGSSIAMTSVFLALLPGISRIYVAMSRDKILPKKLQKIHKKFNSAYIAESIVLVSVILGIYNFDVISSIKLSAFFILIYYSITNLCVINLPKNKRMYSLLISYYGLCLCFIFGLSLVVF